MQGTARLRRVVARLLLPVVVVPSLLLAVNAPAAFAATSFSSNDNNVNVINVATGTVPYSVTMDAVQFGSGSCCSLVGLIVRDAAGRLMVFGKVSDNGGTSLALEYWNATNSYNSRPSYQSWTFGSSALLGVKVGTGSTYTFTVNGVDAFVNVLGPGFGTVTAVGFGGHSVGSTTMLATFTPTGSASPAPAVGNTDNEGMIGSLTSGFGSMISGIGGVVSGIGGLAGNIVGPIVNALTSIWDTLKNLAASIVNGIKDMLLALVSPSAGKVDSFTALGDKFKAAIPVSYVIDIGVWLGGFGSANNTANGPAVMSIHTGIPGVGDQQAVDLTADSPAGHLLTSVKPMLTVVIYALAVVPILAWALRAGTPVLGEGGSG